MGYTLISLLLNFYLINQVYETILSKLVPWLTRPSVTSSAFWLNRPLVNSSFCQLVTYLKGFLMDCEKDM